MNRDSTGPVKEDVITIHHGLNTSTRPWQLTVQLPSPILNVRNKVIALTELCMFNSFANISAALGNNTYSLTWCDGTTSQEVIPDGYYDAQGGSLQAFFESRCIARGWYLQPTSTSSGLSNMYFINVVNLQTFYKLGLQLLPVPSTLPSGYQQPSNATWSLPSSPTTPQLTLPPPAGSTQPYLGQMLGLPSGTYPPTAMSVPYQRNSLFCPQVTPLHCVQVCCDSIQNTTNSNNNLLYSFSTAKAPYLGLFDIEPNNLRFVPMRDFDALTSLTLSFLDGYGNPLAILDPSYNITLILRDGAPIY